MLCSVRNSSPTLGFKLLSAVVIRDKMSRRIPGIWFFVELTEEEGHQRAIQGLNGQALEGRPLSRQ